MSSRLYGEPQSLLQILDTTNRRRFWVFGFAWVIGCVATRYYLREIVCCRKRKGLYAKSTGAYRLDLCLTDSTR